MNQWERYLQTVYTDSQRDLQPECFDKAYIHMLPPELFGWIHIQIWHPLKKIFFFFTNSHASSTFWDCFDKRVHKFDIRIVLKTYSFYIKTVLQNYIHILHWDHLDKIFQIWTCDSFYKLHADFESKFLDKINYWLYIEIGSADLHLEFT